MAFILVWGKQIVMVLFIVTFTEENLSRMESIVIGLGSRDWLGNKELKPVAQRQYKNCFNTDA